MRNIFEEGEYIICSGEGKRENIWRRKKGKTFGEGKYFLQRRRKGGKYLKKGNVCFVEMKNDREGKGGNYFFRGVEENRRRKQRKTSWRKKICMGEQLGGIVRSIRGPRRSKNHCLRKKS